MSSNPIDAITDMLGVVVLDLTALPAGLVAAGWTPPGEAPCGGDSEEVTDPAHGADCWIPVAIRWRHVRAGDVFTTPTGALWLITSCGELEDHRLASGTNGKLTFEEEPVDPDETVTVLVPAAEAAARDLARNELGAKVVDRTV